MANCNEKYTSRHFTKVAEKLIRDIWHEEFDFPWLSEMFSETDTKALRVGIENLLGTKSEADLQRAVDILLGDLPEIDGAFGPNFLTTRDNSIKNSNTIIVENTPKREQRTQLSSVRGSFLGNDNIKNPTAAYTETINDFKKKIVEDVIYDMKKHKLRNVNFVDVVSGLTVANKALYNYKMEIAKELWGKLYPTIPFPSEYVSDIEFTKLINQVLNAYQTRGSEADASGKLFGKYLVLKNFDKLLESEFKGVFIIKQKYKNNNRLANDMYEYSGGDVNYQSSYGDEYADASDYSGRLVKVLLNYLTTKSGRAIGFGTFCYLMSDVKEWAETEGGRIDTSALDERGRAKKVSDIVFGDVNQDWGALIDAYIKAKSISMTSEEYESLQTLKDFIFNSSDNNLKTLFVNQAKKSVKYRYLVVVPKYNPATMRTEMTTVELSDRLIDKQNFGIQKSVQNSVYKLRQQFKGSATDYSKWLESQGIIVDNVKGIITFNNVLNTPGNKSVSFKFESKPIAANNLTPVIKIEQIGNVVDGINDDQVIKLVHQFLGVPVPKDVSKYISEYGSELGAWSTLAVFAKPLIHVILASNPDIAEVDDSKYKREEKRDYAFKNGILSTSKYSSDFDNAARLETKLYSTTDNNVIRNEAGNALPGYQIISAVYEVKQYIYDLQYASNLRSGLDHNKKKSSDMYSHNPLVRKHGTDDISPIGRIFSRGAITSAGYSKESNQLSSKEVFHSEIIGNFLRRLNADKSIILQPIVFSDKKTHFLIEYNIDHMFTEGARPRKYSELLKSLTSSDEGTRTVAKIDVLNEIRSIRADRTKRQIINVLTRFNKVFKLWNKTITYGIDNETLKDKIQKVRDRLARYSNIQKLRDDFGHDVDFNEALDISKYKVSGKDAFDLNYTLLQEVENYILDRKAFDEYFAEQRLWFAKRLAKHKYQFDGLFDPGLRNTISEWRSAFGRDASLWIDDTGTTMKAFRVTDKSGNEITDFDTYGKLDEAFDGRYNVELHPIIEAYMLSDGLLSNSFNDILFGSTNGFTDKGINAKDLEPLRAIDARHISKVQEIESRNLSQQMKDLQLAAEETRYRREKAKRFIRATSSRLSDEFKRTVIAGAIRTGYAQGQKYGVSDKWKMAVIERTKAGAYNYKGDTENVDTKDGSGDVSPYIALEENVSLKDAKQDGNIRKTIINCTDPETGTLSEIKWAERVITNADRRSSPAHSQNSAAVEFEKMHNMMQIEENIQANIDFNRYYNLNNQVFKDEDVTLTHGKELYYKNRLNRKHYKILSVENIVNDYGFRRARITEIEVDKHGTEIGKATSRDVEMNTIYDLDQIFGGAYCEELNEETGNLEYSEANINIVYKIICENGLKDHMIAYTIDDTAIKVGANNVNAKNIFSMANNSPLKYFEIETKHAGLQMNADHEIEEADVSEMGQMISALIQNGNNKALVLRIYDMIGRVAMKNIRVYANVADSNDTEAMYRKLGKLFASAFVSGNRDSISIAEAFITNAVEALNLGRNDNKIPFSSNQIKGIFQSTVTSTLNKLGIRRKYPGLGGINASGYGIRQLYKLGDYFADSDEIEDFIYDDLSKLHQQGKALSFGIGNIFWQQRSTNSTELDNPYIHQLTDLRELLPEDTVVIRETDAFGNVLEPNKDGEVIRIQDLNTLDTFKYAYKKGNNGIFVDSYGQEPKYYQIFKWDYQPRECRQSQDEVEYFYGDVKQGTLYWEDLVTVRAAHYIANYKLNKPGTDPKKVKYNSLYDEVIRLAISTSDDLHWDPDQLIQGLKDGTIKEKDVDELRRKILNYCNFRTQNIARKLQDDNDVDVSVYINGELKSVKLKNHHKHTAQIIMGKANARLLGLQNGDRIGDIMRQGPSFFLDRLANKFGMNDIDDVDPKTYDMVLYGSDGSKTLVVLSYVDSKYSRLDGCSLNSNYIVNSEGNIEKDDIELFSSDGKTFYKTNNGKYDVLVVNSEKALNEVLTSKVYTMRRSNYNIENTKALLCLDYPNNGKRTGNQYTFTKPIKVEGVTYSAEILTKSLPFELAALTKDLQTTEAERHAVRLENLAKKQFQAFKAQLNYILTRIPAQSMQSFMDVEVAVYTDSSLNEVYVPRALQWIQGSDFDIDKDYMMGFGLASDGTLPTLSDLDEDYDAMDVLLLEAPSNRKFTSISSNIGIDKNWFIATFGDPKNGITGDITKLNEILQSGSTVVQYKSDRFDKINGLSDEEIKYLMDILDKHEKSQRTGNIEKLALQNTVVRNILYTLKTPSVQMNMGNPISMKEMQDIAKKSTLSKDELYMTLDVPLVKFDMQEQNMVGREVIGIGAVSLKHYFAASAYMNSRVTVMERILKSGSNYDRILEPLMDIIFNRKLGNKEIITLGNLDFRNILKILDDIGDDVLIAIDENKYKTDANSYLFESEKKYVENGVLNLTKLIKDLNLLSNGTSTDPIDVAFALSQLISAATDNAKELILAKINATTNLADMYTYLLTTGMSFNEISEIMMSPEFNVAVSYAKPNIYEPFTAGTNLEQALNFVLDRSTLSKNNKFDSFFNNVLTEINDATAFLPRLNLQTNILRNFYSLTHDDGNTASDQNVIDYVETVISNKWDSKNNQLSGEYTELLRFIYEELRKNPKAGEILLDVLKSRASVATGEYDVDPDILMDFGEPDPEDLTDPTEMGLDDDGLVVNVSSKGWDDMTGTDARFLYRYVKDYLLPKNRAIAGILKDESRERLEDILDRVLPAMQEQNIHGQLLGINKGIPTDDYGEVNFVRKIENFVNKRYYNTIKAKPDFEPEQFSFIKFLKDEDYRNKQISYYEKVKSSINILKSITQVPHYWSMFSIVRINRLLICRSAALQIERDLADILIGQDKSDRKGVSYGSQYKLNAKEFKELQRGVSDALIYSFIISTGRRIRIPNGYKYYSKDGQETTVLSDYKDLQIEDLHSLASFKRWMDEYVIPSLMAKYPDNEFLMNLTTGLKRDVFTKMPLTFYKPSFNLSDVSRSPKLAQLYEGLARDFNDIYDEDFGTDWTVGDLFYLYNLIVNKDAIGGDSFTRLFEEMASSKDRFSLIYQFNDWLSRLDNGDLRWTGDPKLEKSESNTIVHFGDSFAVSLNDLRIRCSVNEQSDWKFGISRVKDENGNLVGVRFNENPNKEDYVDLTKAVRSDYVLNLPVSANANFVPGKAVSLTGKPVSLTNNIGELVRAIVDHIKDDFGSSIPIHYVTIDEIKKLLKNNVTDEMLNANGFVYNGEIYINSEQIHLNTPIHELMHIVCAGMKYGNNDQRSLYYALLDDINENNPRWKPFFEAVRGHYDWAKGSDFKEEILVRALAHAFETNFRTTWSDRIVDISRVQKTVSDLIEQMFLISQTGERNISEIVNGSFGEVLSIFRSQFMGEDVNKIVRLVVPTNQKIAKFKSMIVDKDILTNNGKC